MKLPRLIPARLALLFGLALWMLACNSSAVPESTPRIQLVPSPTTAAEPKVRLSATFVAPPATPEPTAAEPKVRPSATDVAPETPAPSATFSPTATEPPTETATPTLSPTIAATATATSPTPIVSPTQTLIIDEYQNAASTALGFDDLGDPPPLPTVRLTSLLPTVTPGDLANVGIPPRQVWNGDKTKPRVALTFDTGQATPVVRQVLDALRPLNVHATFFLVGNWAEKNGDVVRTIVADKHELANHSYSHPNFDNLPDDQKIAQMMLTENIVKKQIGCTTQPYFRPPFGAQNKHTQQVIAQAGFLDILWTANGGDWLPGATAESVHQSVVRNTGNGSIIILHSSVTWTAEAVPLIVRDLRARGLEVGTLSELLSGDPTYPSRAPCP